MSRQPGSDLTTLSIADLQRALRAREVSSLEIADAYLAAAAASHLNAFLDIQPELTRAQARAADTALAAAPPPAPATSPASSITPVSNPLLGIPVAHKDIFVTRGWRTTAGSRMLAGYRSPFDAAVVERIASAGAVCLGKLNCDEFAMGSANENPVYGPVRNPWDRQRIAGGSSGGSAAAVAAGLAPFATGTDTGGSVRQPAAMCGVTGIKPTYGRVSRYGMIAYASSLDQGGVIARSAADCALLLQAMAGFDARDSTSLQLPDEDFVAACQAAVGDGATESSPLAGLRIGLPSEFFGEGLAADVRAAVDDGIAALCALGAVAVPVSLPRTALAIPAYYVIAPAEASSNLSRFDGVRYGHRAKEFSDLREMYMHTRAEGFGAEVKRRIMVGAYVLSHGYYDAYYVKAQQLRRLIADDFSRVFAGVDIIAGPVSPTTAWRIGEQTDDPVRNYLADIFTLPASLAGLPAMSVPCGFGAGRLPVGLQLIAPYLQEARLLAVAGALQRATSWHQERPPAQGQQPEAR
jgi:aspartyl-tRNA(Asn)/glutamyl-tRNA(Gln) amidotransferase subunit A